MSNRVHGRAAASPKNTKKMYSSTATNSPLRGDPFRVDYARLIIWMRASGNICSSSSPSRRYSFSSIVTMSTESAGFSSSFASSKPPLHHRQPLRVAVEVVALDVVVVVLPVLRAGVVGRVDVDGVDLAAVREESAP